MSGWLRYFTLKAQARSGLSSGIAIWAIVAIIAALVAVIFLLVAVFVWLSDLYDGLVAGLVLGGLFALIALIALLACVLTRRRNMERARLELAARSTTNWLDPQLLAVGMQMGRAIGWGRLVSLVAVALLTAGVAKEWSGRNAAAAEDDEPDTED